MKRLIALLAAVSSILLCCSCNSETQYVNQGGDRKVTESVSSETEESRPTVSTETVPALDNWEKQKYHTFESDIEILIGEKDKETKHLKIEYATNNDIKVLISSEDGSYYGYIYQHSTHNFYKLSSEYKDKAWRIYTLNGISSIFGNIKNIIIMTCINYQVIRFSEDKQQIAFTTSNEAMIELNEQLNSAIFAYYDDIYKATKNDEVFKKFAAEWLSNYYDLSLGLSKNALRGLLNLIEYTVNQKLRNQDRYKKVSVIIDPSENFNADFEIDYYDPESKKSDKVVTGTLKITGDAPASITIPDDIVVEDPTQKKPDVVDSDTTDDTPEYSEPDSSSQSDDSGTSSKSGIDDWF